MLEGQSPRDAKSSAQGLQDLEEVGTPHPTLGLESPLHQQVTVPGQAFENESDGVSQSFMFQYKTKARTPTGATA